MTISPVTSTSSTAAVSSVADRTTDATLAKALAKLAADKKDNVAADVLRTDQQAVVAATKAADKADEPSTTDGHKVNVTA